MGLLLFFIFRRSNIPRVIWESRPLLFVLGRFNFCSLERLKDTCDSDRFLVGLSSRQMGRYARCSFYPLRSLFLGLFLFST